MWNPLIRLDLFFLTYFAILIFPFTHGDKVHP